MRLLVLCSSNKISRKAGKGDAKGAEYCQENFRVQLDGSVSKSPPWRGAEGGVGR